MIYAKIDSEGNVLEFPYRFRDQFNIPQDAVECDAVSRKVETDWDEALFYDRVEREGDSYVVHYRVGDRKFSNASERRASFLGAVKKAMMSSKESYSSGKITKTQHDMNLALLSSIDPHNEMTYSFYDEVVL